MALSRLIVFLITIGRVVLFYQENADFNFRSAVYATVLPAA